MIVSIIIPTFRDWKRLQTCLDALKGQTYPSENLEIIVVNNDSSEQSPPKDLLLPSNAKMIFEGKPGSYAARNTALAKARGEIIAFTDSDCIPYPDWIENAIRFFQRSNCDRIAGNIELFYKSENLTNGELFEKVYAFRQARYASMGLSVTGNMFAKREVFEKVGTFNEKLFSGGDMEWGRRAQNAGFQITFAPDVTVKHPARSDFAEILKKTKRINGNKKDKFKTIAWFCYYSLPPVFSLFDGKNITVLDRFKVFGMMYYLRMVGNFEQLAVSFGKKPNRE